MPLTLFASAESTVIAWLLAQSEVTASTGSRIRTRLTGNTWPQIRVTRVSGRPDRLYRDVPRVQIECWGDLPDENTSAGDEMDLLARTIAAAVIERGQGRDGDLAAMSVVYGPVPLPDPDTQRVRYLLDVTFSALEES